MHTRQLRNNTLSSWPSYWASRNAKHTLCCRIPKYSSMTSRKVSLNQLHRSNQKGINLIYHCGICHLRVSSFSLLLPGIERWNSSSNQKHTRISGSAPLVKRCVSFPSRRRLVVLCSNFYHRFCVSYNNTITTLFSSLAGFPLAKRRRFSSRNIVSQPDRQSNNRW